MEIIYNRSEVWWVKYHRNGKPFRKSSKSTKKKVVERLLQRREREISQREI